ncbi:armadillo-type protein [Schizophyllum fasciatum]
MEETLSKIRVHTSSAAPAHKTPATLLVAVESTIRDQKLEPTPTAYLGLLLTTLGGTLERKDLSLNEGDTLPAELYLLALIAPFVPSPVVRAKLSTIISLTAPLFPHLTSHAAALRHQLTLYDVVLQALDRSQLDAQGVRQVFASILQLCTDPRPKIRKKAAEVVRNVISHPPTPLVQHPYGERVAEWAQAQLESTSSKPVFQGKGKQAGPDPADAAIYVLQVLRPILSFLPPTALPELTTLVLHLPILGNAFLSQAAYHTLADIFRIPSDDDVRGVGAHVPDVLAAVLASPPPRTNFGLTSAWLHVLGSGMRALHATAPAACAKELTHAWKVVWKSLESDDASVRRAAAEALDDLAACFSPEFIEPALSGSPDVALRKIVAQTEKALDSLAYAKAIPEVLSVASSLLLNLQYRPGPGAPTAAQTLLMPMIKHIGDLRTQKNFEYKEAADATLSTAMRVLGPHVLLDTLPLNLEPEDRSSGREPRAYLLPLLNQPHPSPLSHFVQYFVPLSERMFDLQQKAEAAGRSSEAKVWSVLVAQVWTGLPGYCAGATDLKEALSQQFSALLSQLLYTQSELRPSILRALKTLVESNVSRAASEDASYDPSAISHEAAQANVAFLRTQAASWLAVLFNVFGSVQPDSRGMIGDCITAWASIAPESDISTAFANVFQLIKANLKKDAGVVMATQDIVVILLPYLPASDAEPLFAFCLTGDVLGHSETGVQKRGYKILSRLVAAGKVTIDAEAVLKQLDEQADLLAPAAKKDRFNLLSGLVPLLPPTAMHAIPALIPEAVLGTKEPSEKARVAAFDLVLAMGRKMSEGGVVRRSMIDGMDEDGAPDAQASIEEYITMVAGGLAGATPHMISATVTAISRLVFEWKDQLSPTMLDELVQTHIVFVRSNNREIVKSVLGFVKIAVHAFPADVVRPHLPALVPALLAWSHNHANHFKLKVRHICERMLRRFGWDAVYGAAGEEDAAKVLVNIKKRKDRAKRKRAARGEEAEEEDEEGAAPKKGRTGDAFEDVVYGSESEMEDSDEEEEAGPRKGKAQGKGVRLRVDDDEPMDLLSGAASRVTNTSGKRRKPGKDAAQFKTDEESGRMIIDEGADEEVEETAGDHVGGAAYKESLTSVDGFTRGPNGRVKFNKDTKKRRREEAADEDVEMADPDAAGAAAHKKPRSKKQDPKPVGHEFKAKKAGGDVKKRGVDPYAYVSLSQAAKKKGKMGIAGKR